LSGLKALPALVEQLTDALARCEQRASTSSDTSTADEKPPPRRLSAPTPLRRSSPLSHRSPPPLDLPSASQPPSELPFERDGDAAAAGEAGDGELSPSTSAAESITAVAERAQWIGGSDRDAAASITPPLSPLPRRSSAPVKLSLVGHLPYPSFEDLAASVASDLRPSPRRAVSVGRPLGTFAAARMKEAAKGGDPKGWAASRSSALQDSALLHDDSEDETDSVASSGTSSDVSGSSIDASAPAAALSIMHSRRPRASSLCGPPTPPAAASLSLPSGDPRPGAGNNPGKHVHWALQLTETQRFTDEHQPLRRTH
jgi:hypothetical protein